MAEPTQPSPTAHPRSLSLEYPGMLTTAMNTAFNSAGIEKTASQIEADDEGD